MAFRGILALIFLSTGYTAANYTFIYTPGPVVYFTPPEKVELRWTVPSIHPIFRIQFEKYFPEYETFNQYIITIPKFNYLWIGIYRDRLDYHEQMTMRFNSTILSDQGVFRCKVMFDGAGVEISSDTDLRIRPSSLIQQPAATSSLIQQPAATSSWFNALNSVTNSVITSQTNQSSMQVLKASTYFNSDVLIQLTSQYNKISRSTLYNSDLALSTLGQSTLSLLKSSKASLSAAVGVSANSTMVKSIESSKLQQTSIYSALHEAMMLTSFAISSTKMIQIFTSQLKTLQSSSSSVSEYNSDSLLTSSSLISKALDKTTLKSSSAPTSTAATISSILRVLNSTRSVDSKSISFYSDSVQDRTSYTSKSTKNTQFYSDTVKEGTSYKSKSTKSNILYPDSVHKSAYNISKSSIYSHTSSELKKSSWDTNVQRSSRIPNTKVTHSDNVLKTSDMSMTKFEQTKSSTYPSKITPSTSHLSHTTEQTEPVMQHTISYISASTLKTPKLTVTTLQQMGGISSYKAQYTRRLSYSSRLLPTATLRNKQATPRKQLSDKEIGLSVGLPVAFVFLLGLTVWFFFMKSKVFTSRVCPKSHTEKADNLEAVVALKYIPKDD
ncbi:location of vulva defective 1-like [Rhopilema esculentum]|uniref:location of vulva defective 1-like n=1 Tax=Rhopilema esculentum TaxID=499914 RepID=UPI0031D26A36